MNAAAGNEMIGKNAPPPNGAAPTIAKNAAASTSNHAITLISILHHSFRPLPTTKP